MKKPKGKNPGVVMGRGKGPMAAGPMPNTNASTLPPRKIGPTTTQPVIGEKAGGARPQMPPIPVNGMKPAPVPALAKAPMPMSKGGVPAGSGGSGTKGKFAKGGVRKK
jgi:hypothetical protein